MIPSVAPNALQASLCDEQLVGIGGEIALSGNRERQRKKKRKNQRKKKKNIPKDRV